MDLIIYDYDGPLYQSTDFRVGRFIENAATAGIKNLPDKEFLMSMWGQDYSTIITAMVNKFEWSETETMLFLFHDSRDKSLPEPIEGLDEMLRQQKKSGAQLAIISNRRIHTLRSTADGVGIDLRLFDGVYAIHEDGKGLAKPNPEVLNLLFKRMWPKLKNEDRREMVFIGDTIKHDLKFAQNTGINFIALTSSIHSRTDFLKTGLPDELILDSVLDCPQAIKYLEEEKTAII